MDDGRCGVEPRRPLSFLVPALTEPTEPHDRGRPILATVGRKTPRDGKLELAAADATALATVGAVSLDGERSEARLEAMPCGCRPDAHEHHFLSSDAFRPLAPGTSLVLILDGSGRTVHISLAPR